MPTASPAAPIIRCPSCGAANRVSAEKIRQGLAPVCGKCKKPLPVHIKPIDVTDETWAAQVEQSPLPVLVDAWAPWCGPCRMIAPTIDQIASEFAGQVRVAKLNVDQNPQTAGRLNISGIPALFIFQNGQEVDRIVGLAPKAEIARRLEKVVG